MDRKQIEKIIKIAEDWDLDELEVEDKAGRVKVVRKSPVVVSPTPAAAPAPAAPQGAGASASIPEGLHAICSPMVGIFLATAPDTESVLAVKGARVTTGDALGFVEAMKMQTEIVADTDGEVVEVLVADNQPVEFNQPLFLVRRASETE